MAKNPAFARAQARPWASLADCEVVGGYGKSPETIQPDDANKTQWWVPIGIVLWVLALRRIHESEWRANL